MRFLLPLILSVAAFAQGPTAPFPFVPQSGGASAPSLIQTFPAATAGTGLINNNCTGFATSPSLTCTATILTPSGTVNASMVSTTATFTPSAGSFNTTWIKAGTLLSGSGFSVSGYNVVWTVVTVSGSSITATSGAVSGLASATGGTLVQETASGHYIWVSEITSGAVTSFTTPTSSGTGCPSLTFTVQGTSTTEAAVYKSSTTTSAGPCSVTIAASTTSGITLQGTIREVATSSNTLDVSSIGATLTFCTSCSNATVTTTVNNDIAFCDNLAGGGAGTMAVTSPYTVDINTTGGLDQISGHNVVATAGAQHMAFTASSGSAWVANCFAVEP